MRRIKIREPFWKCKSVGLNEDKVEPEGVEVEILYRNKVTGERAYPGVYWVSRKTVLEAKTMTLSGGVRLRIVPISDMKKLPMSPAELEAYKSEVRGGCVQRMLEFREREDQSRRPSRH